MAQSLVMSDALLRRVSLLVALSASVFAEIQPGQMSAKALKAALDDAEIDYKQCSELSDVKKRKACLLERAESEKLEAKQSAVASVDAIWGAADTTGDGALSLDELMTFYRKGKDATEEDPLEGMLKGGFSGYDGDGDGLVSLAEARSAARKDPEMVSMAMGMMKGRLGKPEL
uniref:EF-hand domain-containing protein n=1 Tax=Alexandrium catenella TaxID=2925 RepID=A0A7S1QV53_ALECA